MGAGLAASTPPVLPRNPVPPLKRNDCNGLHNWSAGPFYISAARTTSEPQKEPPSGLVAVEHCTRCGTLRLPRDFRQFTGGNMGES